MTIANCSRLASCSGVSQHQPQLQFQLPIQLQEELEEHLQEQLLQYQQLQQLQQQQAAGQNFMLVSLACSENGQTSLSPAVEPIVNTSLATYSLSVSPAAIVPLPSSEDTPTPAQGTP